MGKMIRIKQLGQTRIPEKSPWNFRLCDLAAMPGVDKICWLQKFQYFSQKKIVLSFVSWNYEYVFIFHSDCFSNLYVQAWMDHYSNTSCRICSNMIFKKQNKKMPISVKLRYIVHQKTSNSTNQQQTTYYTCISCSGKMCTKFLFWKIMYVNM